MSWMKTKMIKLKKTTGEACKQAGYRGIVNAMKDQRYNLVYRKKDTVLFNATFDQCIAAMGPKPKQYKMKPVD